MSTRTALEQLQYQMSVDIRTLIKQNDRALAKVEGTANKIENRYKKMGNQRIDLGKFLDQTFDRTRIAAFDAGSARIPIFGQALEALGPIGFTAAAGVAATAVAVTQAIAAMRFGAEITDTADRINVSTTALQEWRYVAIETGETAEAAEKLISGFTAKFGEALAGGRAMKWFERLGFTKEDLKAFDSVDEALTATIERISGLSREAERAAVTDKLGLGPMAAAVRRGSDEIANLRDEARETGQVMSAELVAKADAADEEFDKLARKIDVEVKSAFVGLSDEVLQSARAFDAALGALNNLLDAWNEWKARGAISGDGLDETESNAVRLGPAGIVFATARNRLRALRRRLDGDQLTDEQVEDLMRRNREARIPLPESPASTTEDETNLLDLSDGGSRSSGRSSGPSAEEIARRRSELERRLALEIARISGQEQLVQLLEREDQIAQRTAQYEQAKYSAVEARTRAEADQLEIDQARADALERMRGDAQDAAAFEADRLRGNNANVAAEERSRELGRLAMQYREKGLTDLRMGVNAAGELVELAEGEASATGDVVIINRALAAAKADQLVIDQARAEISARIIADAAMERQLQLARIAGDEVRIRQLEQAWEITQRARSIEGQRNLNFGEGDAIARVEVEEEIAAASRRGFRDGVRGLLDDLDDGGLEGVLSGVLDRVSSRFKDQLADTLTDYLWRLAQGQNANGGGSGGGIDFAGIFQSVVGTFNQRAGGGPVRAGRPYIVGEKRAEVFVPKQNGTILPSLSALARSGGVTARAPVINQTIVAHMEGSVLASSLVAELKAEGALQAQVAGGQAYARARADIPAQMARTQRYSRGGRP